MTVCNSVRRTGNSEVIKKPLLFVRNLVQPNVWELQLVLEGHASCTSSKVVWIHSANFMDLGAFTGCVQYMCSLGDLVC